MSFFRKIIEPLWIFVNINDIIPLWAKNQIRSITDMSDLALYIGAIIVGYFVGSRVRSKRDSMTWTGKVQTVAITILVIAMGARMGANREVTENLGDIGVSALIMTAGVMGCTILALFLVRKVIGIDRYGIMHRKSAAGTEDDPEQAEKAAEAAVEKIEEDEKKQGASSMTLIILVSVVIGMLIGYFVIRGVFADNIAGFDTGAGLVVRAGLTVLLLFIGIDLGLEGTVIDNFRAVGFRILIVPLTTITGTLAGAAIMSVVIGLSFKEGLAVGAGFGWYTLAPGIIMEAGYMTASAISFLHNIMRELLSIVFIPLVAKKIGYLESTGMPGAAAMDVCLPIVERATNGSTAVYAFVTGFILSILVPVIVPIIIG